MMCLFLNLYDNGLIRFESQGRFVLTTATPIFTKLRAGLAIGMLTAVLSACGTTNWGLPYKTNVQQGNWITSEQVAQLEKGMTREQVLFIMGSPILQDIFHAGRWDYLYFNKPGYGAEQERKFTVWFQGENLDRWEGDEQPDHQPFQKVDPSMQKASAQSDKDTDQAKSSAPAKNSRIEIRPVNPGASSPTTPDRRSSSQPLL